MKRPAYWKSHCALGPIEFGELHHAQHSTYFAAHDNLLISVVIRRYYEPTTSGCQLAKRFNRIVELAQNSRHCTGASHTGFVHQRSALSHETRDVRKRR